MSRPVRIGNAHGFWGDRIEAAAEMLAAEPDLDYITLDFLAEVSMSILALQRSRDPEAGWPRDVADVIKSLVPYWQGGGQCRLITNGGGLNPGACARACRQILDAAGCRHLIVAVVSGDDILDQLKADSGDAALLGNLDTGESLARIQPRLVTANAYLGAQPLAEALACGADIVITGRVADPSLTVAACAHYHAWRWDDWQRLAGATVAGHLIECGTQVTGGISTDWLELPDLDVAQIGFPIVEVADDGSFIVTKPHGTGGRVCQQTVKEQLVYEIGDPGNYLSPDVTVSFLSLSLTEESRDRMRVSGVSGRPAPSSFKVSATYQDGYRSQGELTIYGADAVAKARRAGQAVLERLRLNGVTFRESLVECLGAGACHPRAVDDADVADHRETVLKIAVADDSRESVERFSSALMPLITAGPPGTTGYSAGRPRVHPVFRYWPCLIERDRVTPQIELLAGSGTMASPTPTRSVCEFLEPRPSGSGVFEDGQPLPDGRGSNESQPRSVSEGSTTQAINELTPGESESERVRVFQEALHIQRLRDIAYARSGDKGMHANVGVIARRPEDYLRLCREATVERVAAHFGIDDVRRVIRYELPNLGAMNFVLRGILANGLRVDAQGKTLGQVLLELRLEAN